MDSADPLRHDKHYQDSSNHVVHFLSQSWHGLLHGQGFDPAPFILLNLVFSAVAFYTGYQSDLLKRNTHTLTRKLSELTEEVDRAMCSGGGLAAAGAPEPG